MQLAANVTTVSVSGHHIGDPCAEEEVVVGCVATNRKTIPLKKKITIIIKNIIVIIIIIIIIIDNNNDNYNSLQLIVIIFVIKIKTNFKLQLQKLRWEEALRGTASPRTALSRTAQHFALFFPLSRHNFHSFFPLSCGLFWWCF